MFPLRDENSHQQVPIATVLLILVNVGVFAYQLSLGEAVEGFIQNFGLLPIEIRYHANLGYSLAISPFTSLLTSMFLHGNLWHALGNLWFLWVFGDNVEESLGHSLFLLFYLVTGVLAGLTHVALNSLSEVPTIGASGAISGVLGGYLCLHPRNRVKTLVALGFYWRLAYVPAYFFIGVWFFLQFFARTPGVAYSAHIGGFLAGVLLTLLLTKKRVGPVAESNSQRVLRWQS